MANHDATTRVRAYRPLKGYDDDKVPCVEIHGGTQAGRVVPLTAGASLIGRAPSAPVSLDEDGVSRHHAKIVIADGVATLVDLASTNGTFLNEAPVDRAELRPGDRIQIGPDVALTFCVRSESELAKLAASEDEVMLSPRELEVARMAADGLSNAEIGRALHISPRTVGTHLRNVYERLELHSRLELTRYLIDRGLVS